MAPGPVVNEDIRIIGGLDNAGLGNGVVGGDHCRGTREVVSMVVGPVGDPGTHDRQIIHT